MTPVVDKLKITPQDHGRRMSLDDFEGASVQEGFHYELGRGIICVSEVPNPWHEFVLDAIRQQLSDYRKLNLCPQFLTATGGGCKILVKGLESERHPDLAVYFTKPPMPGKAAWAVWVPELVIELVSSGSEERDYKEKREEYFQFGVKEYWIFDPSKSELLALRRSKGVWEEHRFGQEGVYQSPLLPGLELNLKPIFEAAL